MKVSGNPPEFWDYGLACVTTPCWTRPQRWLKSLSIGSERQFHLEKKKEQYFGRHRIIKDYLWIGNWPWEELPWAWNKSRKQVCYWLYIPHLPAKTLLWILLMVPFLEGSELFCSLVVDSYDNATPLYWWQNYVGVRWMWLNRWRQNQINCKVGIIHTTQFPHNGYPIVSYSLMFGFCGGTYTPRVYVCVHMIFWSVILHTSVLA